MTIGNVPYLISYLFHSGTAPKLRCEGVYPTKSTSGSRSESQFTLTDKVALGIGPKENDNDKRLVRLNASRKLRALATTIRALNGSQLQVTNRVDGSQMHWSQQGHMVKIGLLNIYDKRFITPADTNLIDIEGDF